MTKQELRKNMHKKRDRYAYIHRDSMRIWDILEKSTIYQEAETIFAYCSFRSEVETWVMIENALRQGKRLCLPRIKEGHQMTFYLHENRMHLQKNRFGIYEPSAHALKQEPDLQTLMLVPGLVFDDRGGRIGYGSGYYDRYLSRYPFLRTMGLCYDFQLQQEKLELSLQDRPMQYLLTPQGIYETEKGEWL